MALLIDFIFAFLVVGAVVYYFRRRNNKTNILYGKGDVNEHFSENAVTRDVVKPSAPTELKSQTSDKTDYSQHTAPASTNAPARFIEPQPKIPVAYHQSNQFDGSPPVAYNKSKEVPHSISSHHVSPATVQRSDSSSTSNKSARTNPTVSSPKVDTSSVSDYTPPTYSPPVYSSPSFDSSSSSFGGSFDGGGSCGGGDSGSF